jgi:hypothetical protein
LFSKTDFRRYANSRQSSFGDRLDHDATSREHWQNQRTVAFSLELIFAFLLSALTGQSELSSRKAPILGQITSGCRPSLTPETIAPFGISKTARLQMHPETAEFDTDGYCDPSPTTWRITAARYIFGGICLLGPATQHEKSQGEVDLTFAISNHDN